MNEFDQQEALLAERRKAYAQQLQGVQAPQGRMVGNTFIAANPLEYLAAGLRGVGALQGQEQANQELQGLQTKRKDANASAMANYLRQLGGAQENKPADGMGPVQQAQAPNISGAFQALAAGPDYQQTAMQGATQYAQTQAQQALKKQENDRLMQILANSTPQQAIAAGVPAETVKNYYESRNYGRDKVTFVDTGGAFTPKTEYGDVPANVAPISKTGNPFSDTLVRDASGQLVANEPLVGAKSRIASAGKPVVNVTNKIENKAAENIAGQVGGILKDSSVAAEGAVKTLDAASRIVSAIDSGKVIAGPLANARVGLSQAAQLLGVGGKDNAEVLSNTRSVIRGLAEMTLQGRKQMAGQGAITESESKLAERAASGDITDLTPAEIKQLAQASARASQWMIKSHQGKLDAAGKLPGTANLVPFFSAPQLPSDMPEGFKVVR